MFTDGRFDDSPHGKIELRKINCSVIKCGDPAVRFRDVSAFADAKRCQV